MWPEHQKKQYLIYQGDFLGPSDLGLQEVSDFLQWEKSCVHVYVYIYMHVVSRFLSIPFLDYLMHRLKVSKSYEFWYVNKLDIVGHI